MKKYYYLLTVIVRNVIKCCFKGFPTQGHLNSLDKKYTGLRFD